MKRNPLIRFRAKCGRAQDHRSTSKFGGPPDIVIQRVVRRRMRALRRRATADEVQNARHWKSTFAEVPIGDLDMLRETTPGLLLFALRWSNSKGRTGAVILRGTATSPAPRQFSG